MFYALHRLVKFAWFCVFIWLGWRVYANRAIFEPAFVWYDVWDNGGFREPPLRSVDFNVDKVITSQVFSLKPTNGIRVNVRLLGLNDPFNDRSIEAASREIQRRDELQRVIEHRDVTLKVGYENLNNLGGFVYCNGTNVNAWMIQRRYAFSSKEKVKGFPKEIQYQMLWAMSHRDGDN